MSGPSASSSPCFQSPPLKQALIEGPVIASPRPLCAGARARRALLTQARWFARASPSTIRRLLPSALTHAFPPPHVRGIDLKHGGRQIGKSHRKEAKSENVYLRLLTKVRQHARRSPSLLPRIALPRSLRDAVCIRVAASPALTRTRVCPRRSRADASAPPPARSSIPSSRAARTLGSTRWCCAG